MKMAFVRVEAIRVNCWGREVGALSLDEASGFYAFEYYPDFRTSGWELAPLEMPLTTRTPLVFTRLAPETYRRLPAFIVESLPDRFGNALVDAWMSRQGLSREDVTPLDRLAYMGKRGMGALEFEPVLTQGAEEPNMLQMGSLVEASRRALHVLARGGQMPEDEALLQLMRVGTSAAGAKAKAVVGWNPATEEFVSGQFALPAGFEPWLVKFDTSPAGAQSDFGRVEYAYYRMACDCGVDMAASRMLELDGRAHFMTRRFDRDASGAKIHMLSLNGMAGLDFNQIATHDYIQLFQTADELGLGYDAHDQLFKRMVFNVCMANNDDHTKNHAFLLERDGEWKLAPAYDLMYAHNPSNRWTSRHLMGVRGVFSDVTREDLLAVARMFNVRLPGECIERTIEVAKRWDTYAAEAGVNDRQAALIRKDIAACIALVR